MRLITGVQLTEQDVQAIKEGTLQAEEAIGNKLNAVFQSLKESDYTLQPAKVLGYMLKNNILEIKIADLTGLGIFHPKTGIFWDGENNSISFSGSENETARGWEKNAEEFKVFKKWEPVQEEYYDGDLDEFNSLWNNLVRDVKVYDFPDAIKHQLIKFAPPDYEGVKRLDLGHDDGVTEKSEQKTPYDLLWPQQRLAIGAWFKPPRWQENLARESNSIPEAKILFEFLEKQSTNPQPVTNNRSFQGILSMATGAGKTRAAVAAAVQATKNVITIIAMPSQIRQQWENEIKLWDSTAKIIYGGGDGSNWRKLLPNQLQIYRLGSPSSDMHRTFVLCTYATIGMEEFVNLFDGIQSKFVQVIGDEVHHFAGQTANAFNIKADRVLGLSATHTRWWDDPGTAEIERHFGEPVYEFDIQDGINNEYLCHYNYHIHFVELTSNEIEQYRQLNGKIGFKKEEIRNARRDHDPVAQLEAELESLWRQKSKILKEAENKPAVVGEILRNSFSGTNEKAIIFCEDTAQTEKIRQVLDSQNKSCTEITIQQSQKQRNSHLREFRETNLSRFILGVQMLDEGIDVPESDKCIIVASTTNPRQFIQRRGRVLRRSERNPTKVAEVHDTIVVPDYSVPIGELTQQQEKEAKRMAEPLNKEIIRLHQMMDAADNTAAVINDLSAWVNRHRLQDYVEI